MVWKLKKWNPYVLSMRYCLSKCRVARHDYALFVEMQEELLVSSVLLK